MHLSGRTRPGIRLAAALILAWWAASAPAAPFLAGADFSDLALFESDGVTYKDAGQVEDGLSILKAHGINCVRLRLFTSSAAQAAADPYNYGNNLSYTLSLAQRVKAAGLLLLLDFHYSDTWADPGHQATPSAWTNLNFTQLVQEMRGYNSNTLAAFVAAGARPDYVQIGNEITSGMLWPLGEVPGGNAAAQWSQLGQLMKAAEQGIEDATGTNRPQFIVHIDRGGDWATTQWFFDNLNAQGVPFDIIGESYYPFFHGPLSGLDNCLTNAALRYGKPLLVAETAFPWTNTFFTTNIEGFAPSVTGQIDFIAGLAGVIESVPSQLMAGVIYWGAEYQAVAGINEAGYNTSSFFDFGGNLLPAADAIAGLGRPLVLSASCSGASLQLQWPLSGAGSRLLTATALGGAGDWTPVSNAVIITNAAYQVTLPVAASRFYRLQAN